MAKAKYIYSRKQLEEAVKNSRSYAGVLSYLGRPQAGGSQAYISQRIRKEGIDTSHFLGQAWNRGGKSRKKLAADEVLVLLPKGSNKRKTEMLRRALEESGIEEKCAECGLSDTWNSKTIRLHIHHINGDWLDNRIENLAFLCPNCHSQTDSYCKNRKS